VRDKITFFILTIAMSQRKRPSRYIPKHVKEAVRERDRDRCRICGRTSEYMEFDHITPYSKGAPATVENIQQVCRKCNLAKRDKTPKCSQCGSWIPHDADFCQKCGSRQFLSKSTNNFGLRADIRKVIGILLLLYVIIYLLSHAK
jgi:ribosomal protein L40E